MTGGTNQQADALSQGSDYRNLRSDHIGPSLRLSGVSHLKVAGTETHQRKQESTAIILCFPHENNLHLVNCLVFHSPCAVTLIDLYVLQVLLPCLHYLLCKIGALVPENFQGCNQILLKGKNKTNKQKKLHTHSHLIGGGGREKIMRREF